jgi:hypothetical protein
MITAEDRERRRPLLDKFERLVWRLNVEARFVRAMQAAAAGEPIDWQVWPPTDPQAVIDQAATEYVCGYAEIMLDREPESHVIPDPLPSTAEILDRLARHRAEHGPFLRELRGSWFVVTYLAAALPKAETGPLCAAAFTGVPAIEDNDIPARHLRLVYDDDTTRDLEIIKLPAIDRFGEFYRSSMFTTPFTSAPTGIISNINPGQ